MEDQNAFDVIADIILRKCAEALDRELVAELCVPAESNEQLTELERLYQL